MKFKKLYRDETVYIENGYATNGKWCVSVAWLAKQKNRANMQLRRRVDAATVEAVTERLAGREHETKPIREAILSKFSDAWKPVSLADAKPLKGYYRGNPETLETVAYQIPTELVGDAHGNPSVLTLDAEYFCALLWDSALTLHVRGACDPIFGTVNGEIVYVVAPLKPEAVFEGMEIPN